MFVKARLIIVFILFLEGVDYEIHLLQMNK